MVTPLFSPLCPQHSSPEPLPFPSPTPQPRQATESSPPPQRWTSHPDGSTFRTLEPPTANSPLHGAASATGLSTAPDLLDRHHGPPHRICLTGALIHHSVGPSLTPSSVPSLALHTSPRPPQQIRLTESTVQRARRSLRPLHQTRSTDAIFNSTGPDLPTPQPHQVISICTPSVFLFIVQLFIYHR